LRFGLEKIALSLSEQLPARVDQSLQVRKDRFEKMGVAALSVWPWRVQPFALRRWLQVDDEPG